MNVFLYYGSTLLTPEYFETVTSNTYLLTFVTAVATAPGLAVAVAMVDRAGRRLTQAIMLFSSAIFVGLLALQKVAPVRALPLKKNPSCVSLSQPYLSRWSMGEEVLTVLSLHHSCGSWL